MRPSFSFRQAMGGSPAAAGGRKPDSTGPWGQRKASFHIRWPWAPAPDDP
jgi:hypothetical protein